MIEKECGSLPVASNNKLVGMITDRDIVTRAVSLNFRPEELSVEEVMSSGIRYCFENDDIWEVGRKMVETRTRRMPVLDRNKQLVGNVSLGDFARSSQDRDLVYQTYNGVSH